MKPLIQVCKDCHVARRDPQFNSDIYPYRDDRSDNALLVKRIYGAVTSNPAYKRMPPGMIPVLPQESLAKLREWIQNGALTESLQPTLTDAEIEEILND